MMENFPNYYPPVEKMKTASGGANAKRILLKGVYYYSNQRRIEKSFTIL
jgi:hypothetical protein